MQDSERASGSLSNSAELIITVMDVNDENPKFIGLDSQVSKNGTN